MQRLTVRSRSGAYWCTAYANEFAEGCWNLGVVINKSKRASNDWYERRKNRRVRKVKSEQKVKTIKQIATSYRNIIAVINKIPLTHDVFIMNDFEKSTALSRYTERLGFISVPWDGRLVWVLTAQRRQEVQLHYERTN